MAAMTSMIFNEDNDDAADDDGDQYLSRKRVKIRVRILVVTEVMSSDINGDADRKNMTKPLKHTSTSQPWFPVLPVYFHEFPMTTLLPFKQQLDATCLLFSDSSGESNLSTELGTFGE